METTIFYFSATGNSLSLSRNLANELGNCEVVSIAKVHEPVKLTTPRRSKLTTLRRTKLTTPRRSKLTT